MFIVSKRKYDSKVQELNTEIEKLNLEIIDDVKTKRKIKLDLHEVTKKLDMVSAEYKQQKIIISQYEIKAKKDNEKIEKLEKENDKLKQDNEKKSKEILNREMLRRKAAGKVGGLKAALVKRIEENKNLTEIISKQEEENKSLKRRITPPTRQQLENYKLFRNKNGKKSSK